MRTQISIVRDFATGMVDGFMCDLVLATERKLGPKIASEDDLISQDYSLDKSWQSEQCACRHQKGGAN